MRAWELKVNGIIEADEAMAEALEARLAQELHAVISKAEYGVHHSVLGTPSVFGSVHTPQTPTVELPTIASAPEPAPVQPIVSALPAVPLPTAVPGPDVAALLGGFDPAKLAQLAEYAQSLGIGVPSAPPEAPTQP
jgi:hypothetical protein